MAGHNSHFAQVSRIASLIAAAAHITCAAHQEGTKAMPTATAATSDSTAPQALHQALAQAFNRRDIDGLLSLYAADATLVPQPGATVAGTFAIRQVLSGFLSLSPRDTFVETVSVVRAGDLALTRSHWGLNGTQPGGVPVALDHRGAEIMRLHQDGTWRFLVDDPFAGDDVVVRDEPGTASGGGEAPGALHQRMARLFNERSLDGLVALYTDDATLVAAPGKAVSGRAALREALAGFLALQPRAAVFTTVGVVRTGDVALTRSHWSMVGSTPQGDMKIDHHGLEVMRRHANGTWQFVVDDPFAGDAAAAQQ